MKLIPGRELAGDRRHCWRPILMLLPRRSLLKTLSCFALMPLLRNAALAADEDGVDLKALAKVRPGMPASALQAAFGARWRTLEPHKGGEVDRLETSHHFKARVDVNGKVGEVVFSEGFSPS